MNNLSSVLHFFFFFTTEEKKGKEESFVPGFDESVASACGKLRPLEVIPRGIHTIRVRILKVREVQDENRRGMMEVKNGGKNVEKRMGSLSFAFFSWQLSEPI